MNEVIIIARNPGEEDIELHYAPRRPNAGFAFESDSGDELIYMVRGMQASYDWQFFLANGERVSEKLGWAINRAMMHALGKHSTYRVADCPFCTNGQAWPELTEEETAAATKK